MSVDHPLDVQVDLDEDGSARAVVTAGVFFWVLVLSDLFGPGPPPGPPPGPA